LDAFALINKRIAVLDFPDRRGVNTQPVLSQLIVQEIVQALESTPELATYGYISQDVMHRRWDLGHAAIELGNEVLTLNDVRLVQTHLEEVDTAMISGEGRHMRRRELEIHYTVRGDYEML
jgi:hypothetical protein